MKFVAYVLLGVVGAGCQFDDYLDGKWEGQCTAETSAGEVKTISVFTQLAGQGVIAGASQLYSRGESADVAEPTGHWEGYFADNGLRLTRMDGIELRYTYPGIGECRTPVCKAGAQPPEISKEGVFPSIDEGVYPRGTLFISMASDSQEVGEGEQFLFYGNLTHHERKLSGPCRWEENTEAGVEVMIGTGVLDKTAYCTAKGCDDEEK